MAVKPFHFGTVLFITLLLINISCSDNKNHETQNTNGIAQYQYYNDIPMWTNIFTKTDAYLLPDLKPDAILIPHHDITVANQNSYYKALKDIIEPSVIFIISPDHFEHGNKIITMPKDTVFYAPDGELEVDYDLIAKISDDSRISDYVSLQDDVWFEEHGIFGHTPFIKHYFPNTKIIPIVLKMLSEEDEFEYYKRLGKVISDYLPQDGFVIASVDCSHYQIPSVTEFHDYVVVNTFMRYEDPRYAEIDSPETMTTLFSFLKEQKMENAVIIHQSSTLDFIPDEMTESTSHLYINYYKDEIFDSKIADKFYEQAKNTNQRARKINTDEIAQTLFFAGSGKTGAGIRKTWTWDRYNTSTDPADKLLQLAGGKEGRFLYGYDALIFDPLPDTVYERELHGTKLIVETVMQSSFDKMYESNKSKLQGNITDPYPDKSIRVLEVVLENEKKVPDDFVIQTMLKKYNIIVFRDDDGLVDAYLFSRKNPYTSDFEKVNLGICHSTGYMKGSVAMINFDGDRIDLKSYEYESSDGILPEICQVYPRPGTPLLSEQKAPGDRES